MTRRREAQITDKQALQLKPRRLPPVEPELAAPCPRPMVWVARAWSHGQISQQDASLLRHGQAARAWITSVVMEHDREGPEIRATFAFFHGPPERRELHHGTFHGSYDAMHLVIGFPDLARWLNRAIRSGGTLTVLYPQGRPEAQQVYAAMELYLERRLEQLLADFQGASGADRDGHLADLRALLRGPIGPLNGDYPAWKRYFNMMARMGGVEPTGNTTLFELVDAALEAMARGKNDPHAVGKLSKMCREYMPGIWAAA